MMIARELAETAFEMSPTGLLVVDKQGFVIAVNGEVERMFGYARGELIGNSIDLLVPLSRVKSHESLRTHYMSALSARPMGAGRDLYGRHHDGHDVPVEIGLRPVAIQGVQYVLCTVIDIAERRGLEQQLRQAQKLEAVGNLASGIAHDFNNILHGIIGYSELVRESVADRSDVRDDVDVILESARRGRDLVRRILAFSRKSNAASEEVNLGAVLQEVTRLLRATLPRKIELLTVIDPQTPEIIADSTELHQVLMNLINNATHAIGDAGGVIDIRVEPRMVDNVFAKTFSGLQSGLHVHLSVTDTGSGMSKEVLERVFEPFFTTKPVGYGTGIGLAAVQEIVRKLQGAISVESEPGRGTQFQIFLPAKELVAASNTSDCFNIKEPNRPRILYIDDEEHLAQLGYRLLRSAGFDVIAYSSSLHALNEFSRAPERYRLIITDNNMPHMSGIELSRAITAIRPSTPIIMGSGNGESIPVEELKKAGIRRLIPKPYEFCALKETVEELIDQHTESSRTVSK
jgi:PAS domain S-box-containing protein